MKTNLALKEENDILAEASSVTADVNETTSADNGENMQHKITYVKVKIQSLADEARFIRLQETKQKTRYRDIDLKNRLRAGVNVGDKVLKWTVTDKTNDVVTLTRCISIAGENQLVVKTVNLAKIPKENARQTAHDTFWGLRLHRTQNVRIEARASHLAYAFLRGKTYASTENAKPVWVVAGRDCWDFDFKSNIYPRLVRIAQDYSMGDKPTPDQIKDWILGR